jgi:hypothetical protein
MPIPEFTEYGLLPQGIHSCTSGEAEQFLCSNEHRSAIWNGLQEFFAWAATLPKPNAILIDGSYVTDKPTPADVDVVVDISSCSVAEQQVWVDGWIEQRQGMKDVHKVDFYPFASDHGNDFSAYFQYVRVEDALRRGVSPLVRKGILKVVE